MSNPLMTDPRDSKKDLLPAVQLQGLNHYFGTGELREQILRHLNCAFHPGEFVIITGESGGGKTTTLTLIGGLRTVQEGSVRVLGRELRGLSPVQLTQVRRSIGFIFQAHNLFGSLTAVQNVAMALELHDIFGTEKLARATEALQQLELGHRLHHKPEDLSGGQRQRVAVARAVVTQPSLILADEPTAALDEKSARLVVNLLKQLARTRRTTILMVTHDKRILDVADRMIEINHGKITSNVVVNESLEKCEFLMGCPIFEGTTPAVLLEVAEQMTRQRVATGTTIIQQGSEGDRFYVIRAGTVEVQSDSGSGPRKVATLGKGNYFGERALITGELRNATVVALEPVELYTLGKQDFQKALAAAASFQAQLRKEMFVR